MGEDAAPQAEPDRNGGSGFWSRLLKWFEVLLVPLAVLIVGLVINNTIARAQLQADYVGVAVGVLAADRPTSDDGAESDADEALREWAVEVLALNSPVEITKEVQLALRQGDVILAATNVNLPLAGGWSQYVYLPPNPPDGTLPALCTVTIENQIDVRGEPGGAKVGTLTPGTYSATEAATAVDTVVPSGLTEIGLLLADIPVRFFKLGDAGWVRVGLGVTPHTSCYLNT